MQCINGDQCTNLQELLQVATSEGANSPSLRVHRPCVLAGSYSMETVPGTSRTHRAAHTKELLSGTCRRENSPVVFKVWTVTIGDRLQGQVAAISRLDLTCELLGRQVTGSRRPPSAHEVTYRSDLSMMSSFLMRKKITTALAKKKKLLALLMMMPCI